MNPLRVPKPTFFNTHLNTIIPLRLVLPGDAFGSQNLTSHKFIYADRGVGNVVAQWLISQYMEQKGSSHDVIYGCTVAGSVWTINEMAAKLNLKIFIKAAKNE